MLGILINVDECIGCHACEAACKNSHEFPKEIMVQRVVSVEEGKFPSVKTLHSPVERCMHCLEPACVSACPFGAITKTERGPVIIDHEKCTGCQLCVKACPWNIPKFSMEAKKVYKCDFCYSRLQEGLSPACVEVCPVGALKFGDREELLKEAKAEKKYIYGEVEAGGTSLIYASNEPLTKIGLPKLFPEELEILAVNPDAQRAFAEFRTAVLKESKTLPRKVKRLLTIVAYAVAGCEECVEECTREALSEGIKRNEILDALTIACLVKGGSALNTCKKAFKILKEKV
ncbi:MAG: 4Fe-4S dicluster domain-containing protein [Candidatus Bathyarchaeia archaeon]